ncbi:MAG TPA: 50S ribosomal protein L10 [Phototrophicaceae bacterium]|nr:50S ribosomal protein L10 [Phototrophicaceae bacterium]
MAITKETRERLVSEYVELLNNTSGFIIIQYAGMPTPEINQLRAKIRDANGKYVVAKNTLLTKALQQCGWPVPEDLLAGPSAIAFGMDNLPGVAKAVVEYLTDKDVAKIAAKGGIMSGNVFNAAQVDVISKLPTLDELRAQIAGLIVAPATGIVSVLQGVNSQIVNVLQAYLDEHKEGDAA